MGREQPARGQVGEFYAQGFLRSFFQECTPSQAGSAVDLICTGLRAVEGSAELHPNPTVRFRVQVKNTISKIHVARSTLLQWLMRVETEPIILLVGQNINSTKQRWNYLCIHDWLLTEAGQQALVTKGAFRIPLAALVPHGGDDARLLRVLQNEANRAAGIGPLSTGRPDYGQFAFDEGLLLQFAELAPYAEIPFELYEKIAREESVPDIVRRLLETGTVNDGLLQEWLRMARIQAPGPCATSFQRRHLLRFVRAFEQWSAEQIPVRLPRFHVAEVGAWRAFVSMFPQSIGMMSCVVCHSRIASDIMFAASMLPIFAIGSQRLVQLDACKAIRMLVARSNEFPSYAYRRELLRAPAEAGDAQAVQKVTDFVTRVESRRAEHEFLSRYGWPAEMLEANLERKLNRPTLRDRNLRFLYEGMADSLLSRA